MDCTVFSCTHWQRERWPNFIFVFIFARTIQLDVPFGSGGEEILPKWKALRMFWYGFYCRVFWFFLVSLNSLVKIFVFHMFIFQAPPKALLSWTSLLVQFDKSIYKDSGLEEITRFPVDHDNGVSVQNSVVQRNKVSNLHFFHVCGQGGRQGWSPSGNLFGFAQQANRKSDTMADKPSPMRQVCHASR